jgi:hypothetical protein
MNTSMTLPLFAQIDLLTPLAASGGFLVGDALLFALAATQVVCVTAIVVGAVRLHKESLSRLTLERLARRAP